MFTVQVIYDVYKFARLTKSHSEEWFSETKRVILKVAIQKKLSPEFLSWWYL